MGRSWVGGRRESEYTIGDKRAGQMVAQLDASADRSGCVPSHGRCVASEGFAVGCGGDGARDSARGE
eukprot:4260411-Prymnesium_polylepis.1